MSVHVMAKVWGDVHVDYADGSKHAGSELLLLMAIADFADDDGNAFPAISTLAKKCRLSDRYVNMLLAKLRDSGELEIHLNEGWKGANRYRVLTGMKSASPLKPASPRSPLPKGVKPASEGGEAGFPKPLKPASPEPSLNHHRTTKKPSRGSARTRTTRARTSALHDGFVVSERVKTWAAAKGYGDLDKHLEAFVGKAKANGYEYVDWDEALMNAIRDDWAKTRQEARGHRASNESRKASNAKRMRDQDYGAGVGRKGGSE
jgi:hypothetical protein